MGKKTANKDKKDNLEENVEAVIRECSCSVSTISVVPEIERPEILSVFDYDLPFVPELVLQTNFACDDICNWNPTNLMEKMTARWDDDCKWLCVTLLNDVRLYCDDNLSFNNFKLLAAVEMFFFTLKYIINSRTANTQDAIDFFEEQLLRYSVEHPPKSLEVFSIDESFKLLQLFERLVLSHLVLLRAITAHNCTVELKIAPDEMFMKKGK